MEHMNNIIEFRKINIEEIDTVDYIEENGNMVCRFTTYDGHKRDFILADAATKQFRVDRIQKLIKFMVSFGIETEEQITCDGGLYRYPSESHIFGVIHSFYDQVKIKQICMKYSYTYNSHCIVVNDNHLGNMELYDLITDYHGKLKKCVGKDCAKELIDFYNTSRIIFHSRYNIDTHVVLMQ